MSNFCQATTASDLVGFVNYSLKSSEELCKELGNKNAYLRKRSGQQPLIVPKCWDDKATIKPDLHGGFLASTAPYFPCGPYFPPWEVLSFFSSTTFWSSFKQDSFLCKRKCNALTQFQKQCKFTVKKKSEKCSRDFSGCPVVNSLFPPQGAWAWSLVRELRSIRHSQKIKKKCEKCSEEI